MVIRHHDTLQLERELLEGLAYLETCRECPTPAAVGGCVHCKQDHGMREEPALVAGITAAPQPSVSARPAVVRVEDVR